jgi:hypothetical protein
MSHSLSKQVSGQHLPQQQQQQNQLLLGIHLSTYPTRPTRTKTKSTSSEPSHTPEEANNNQKKNLLFWSFTFPDAQQPKTKQIKFF